MRKIILILSSVFVLAVLNFAIYEKEEVIENGESVLLKLAPVDPRSLMQGDYMRLRYAIEREASKDGSISEQKRRGYLVILPDENSVAHFIKFYNEEKLAKGEKLLRYRKPHDSSLQIVPDSFLFQEGHAKFYEKAEYGEFKFNDSGKHILVGLVDEKYQGIVPE